MIVNKSALVVSNTTWFYCWWCWSLFVDIQQHSHPIGPDNLQFTRRGRKAAALADKDRSRNKSDAPAAAPPDHQMVVASTSNVAHQPTTTIEQPVTTFSSAVSMLAPLPGQTFVPTPQPQPFTFPTGADYAVQSPNQDRWDNMTTLFQNVREHARTYNYPPASVAALETVLIRLYLESPIGAMPQQGIAGGNPALANRPQPQPVIQMQTTVNGNATDGATSGVPS